MAEGLAVLVKPGNAGGGKGCVKKMRKALCCTRDEGRSFGAVL